MLVTKASLGLSEALLHGHMADGVLAFNPQAGSFSFSRLESPSRPMCSYRIDVETLHRIIEASCCLVLASHHTGFVTTFGISSFSEKVLLAVFFLLLS